VLQPTPVPGLGAGLGAMPRFRAEIGPFVGLVGIADSRITGGGFVASQRRNGRITGLEMTLRAGLGLEGVMGDAGDGLVFASVGLRADSASTNKFIDGIDSAQGGSILAAVPARTGLSLRLRAPFYLVPGDLLLLSPLLLASPDTYTAMAVTASNGGLIPWQTGLATRFGRFQFVLGRELGLTLYGRNANDQLLAPDDGSGLAVRSVRFRSTLFNMPILEYRPYRAFAGNQSSSVMFQLFAAADVPGHADVVSPRGAPPVLLNTIWSLGLRMVFDWRYYR
jgi:hypothetical protein